MTSVSVPTYTEIDSRLTGPGEPFEIETIEISGRPTRIWRNAPRSLGEALAHGAEVAPDRDFIVLGGERVSHAEHYRQVADLATALADELGVHKGDRVAIATRNLPEWSVAFFAATMVGAIAVPLNSFWTGGELTFAINDSEPKVLFADGERLERLAPHAGELGAVALVGTRLDDRNGTAELPPGVPSFADLVDGRPGRPGRPPAVDVQPEDPATIFYTSGTTGFPKGVLGTHRNICTNLFSLMYAGARGAARAGGQRATGPRAATVMLLPVPLFHATGCHSILVAQAYFGGTLVFMRKWDPEVALDLIEGERVTACRAFPPWCGTW